MPGTADGCLREPQAFVEVLADSEGNPPGEPSDVFWLFKTPEALRKMLVWMDARCVVVRAGVAVWMLCRLMRTFRRWLQVWQA